MLDHLKKKKIKTYKISILASSLILGLLSCPIHVYSWSFLIALKAFCIFSLALFIASQMNLMASFLSKSTTQNLLHLLNKIWYSSKNSLSKTTSSIIFASFVLVNLLDFHSLLINILIKTLLFSWWNPYLK